MPSPIRQTPRVDQPILWILTKTLFALGPFNAVITERAIAYRQRGAGNSRTADIAVRALITEVIYDAWTVCWKIAKAV